MPSLLFANTKTIDLEIKEIMEGHKLFQPGDMVGVSSREDIFFGYVRFHAPDGVFVVIRDDFGETEIFEKVDNVFRLPWRRGGGGVSK